MIKKYIELLIILFTIPLFLAFLGFNLFDRLNYKQCLETWGEEICNNIYN